MQVIRFRYVNGLRCIGRNLTIGRTHGRPRCSSFKSDFKAAGIPTITPVDNLDSPYGHLIEDLQECSMIAIRQIEFEAKVLGAAAPPNFNACMKAC